MNEIPHPYEEILDETLEDVVSQKSEEDAGDAYTGKGQFADENCGAFSWLMDRVDVIGCGIVVL